MTFWALPFMRTAFLASLLAGTALAWLGMFSVTRPVAFAGLAAAQWAALGGVLGAALGLHLGASALSGFFVLGALLLSARLGRSRRTSADSWVAALYVLGAAGAVLFLAKSPRGESEALGVFFGNVLSLGGVEVLESAGLFIGTILILGLWFHRWVWIAFDPLGAEVAGWRVDRWTALFQLFFAGAITLSIHVLGVLLAFAYLLLPATAGLLMARRPRGWAVFGATVAAAATVAGFELSYRWDLPTGPFVAGLLALIALAARAWTVGRRTDQ